MSWQAAMLHEQHITQIKQDHGLAESRMETFRRPVRMSTSMWSQGYRKGWWDAIAWLLHTQSEWESLPPRDTIHELRKGQSSIYWPLFHEDPRVVVDCPEDGRTVIGVEGHCEDCGYDFDR